MRSLGLFSNKDYVSIPEIASTRGKEIPPHEQLINTIIKGRKAHSENQSFFEKTNFAQKKGVRNVVLVFVGFSIFGVIYAISRATNQKISSSEILENAISEPPFSREFPPTLDFKPIERNRWTNPGPFFGEHRGKISANNPKEIPKPTNVWYQNLLVGGYNGLPSASNKAYTIPYVIDTVGPIVGIRINWPFIHGSSTTVSANYVETYGLTLGSTDHFLKKKYEALPCNGSFSPLSVKLKWDLELSKGYMLSPITRGMPFATMKYVGGIQPSISSSILPSSDPIVDDDHHLKCGTISNFGITKTSSTMVARKSVHLHFFDSDFSWIVMFSQPAQIECYMRESYWKEPHLGPGIIAPQDSNKFHIKVLNKNVDEFIVKVAIVHDCTTGRYDSKHCRFNSELATDYLAFIQEHSAVHSECPDVQFAFTSLHNSTLSQVTFDWDVRRTNQQTAHFEMEKEKNLRMHELPVFALPHHISQMQSNATKTSFCIKTLHGNMCIVVGNKWIMHHHLVDSISFNADIPPRHWAVPAIAHSLSKDIYFTLPDNIMRGACDTYFSGKMLSKLARIILISHELRTLPKLTDYDDLEEHVKLTIEECKKVRLPSDKEMNEAVERLKQGIEIWLNGTAEAAFVYDRSWGGVISCGCFYGDGHCWNNYPSCPSVYDVDMNFGNGFYNDHHFHYGYFIYAAAVVAKFDNAWGRKYFQQVMLLIRDIANPSSEDPYFPRFRVKDFFLGNSYAGGIALIDGNPYPNGRNQESASEAIFAYEAMTLYGKVMMECWDAIPLEESSLLDVSNFQTAKAIQNFGLFLTETELFASDQFYRVSQENNVYPREYDKPVVGILWETMAEYKTWFGDAPYEVIGIQLLPLTPIAGRRDDPIWALQRAYPFLSTSCSNDSRCTKEGWIILMYAMLALIGKPKEAMDKVLNLSDDVFNTPAADGHSISNTLWYVSTRGEFNFSKYERQQQLEDEETNWSNKTRVDDLCSPAICEAFLVVGDDSPIESAPHVCYERGPSYGSFSAEPWRYDICLESCLLTPGCDDVGESEQLCSPYICTQALNWCPFLDAPYYCNRGQGRNSGRCSTLPWDRKDCRESCMLQDGCMQGAPRSKFIKQ